MIVDLLFIGKQKWAETDFNVWPTFYLGRLFWSDYFLTCKVCCTPCWLLDFYAYQNRVVSGSMRTTLFLKTNETGMALEEPVVHPHTTFVTQPTSVQDLFARYTLWFESKGMVEISTTPTQNVIEIIFMAWLQKKTWFGAYDDKCFMKAGGADNDCWPLY